MDSLDSRKWVVCLKTIIYQITHHSQMGMDYFGPFEVKWGWVTVKRCGVLFTCLTSKAVHIEVADSLDTTSALMLMMIYQHPATDNQWPAINDAFYLTKECIQTIICQTVHMTLNHLHRTTYS